MTGDGEIPQSPALAEVETDSLSELMSRDPEGYSKQDLTRVVEALRAQRVRLNQVATTPKVKAEKPKLALKVNFNLDMPVGTRGVKP